MSRTCLPRALSAAVSGLVLLAGCDGTISLTFSTGPQEFEVSTDSLALPMELRAEDGTIAEVPCGEMGFCPPSEEVVLACEAGLCDPAPKTFAAPVGDVVDVDELLAEGREIGLTVVDEFVIERVAYDVLLNTLTVPVGEIEVFWGPEAATTIDPALNVRRFGTLPAIPAGQTGAGELRIDADGVRQLSDFLVSGNTRFRFFAQTTVDLEPGDPYPEGGVRVSINLTIRAIGRLID